MPAINYSQRLLEAKASAATDWGSVAGKVESEVTAGAALKRGLKVEAGLSALAEIDAGLSKFIAAQVTGRAEASAHVTAQVQFPLNLFEEAGAAVRLQAVAEAAAGVEASIGLSIGDFIELARGVLGGDGVALRLFLLFLEEIDLTAGVYAKAAATAQAQAYATIVGSLRNDSARGLKPGFNIVAGAGLGLAAGAGVRLVARARFRDFPRFYARSVDLAVDAVFDEAARRLGTAAGPAVVVALDAARPPLKMAFRLAYEVGELLATRNPPQSTAGAAELAARAVAVTFEEGQRFLLRTFVHAALKELRAMLRPQLRGLNATGRARIKPRRDALVARLRSRPADPFDLSSPAAQDFWIGVVESMEALTVEAFAGATISQDLSRALAAAWCAAQLLLVATKRATRADASFSVVGQPANAVRAAFVGAPAAQPPRIVSDALASGLGVARPSGGWKLEHAAAFLATVPTTTLLETAAPQVKPFLEAFRGILGSTTATVAKTILGNIGALPSSAGAADSRQTLRDLLTAVRKLVTEVLDAQAMPALRTALADSPETLLYLNDVLRPGADFALGTSADLLLDWASGDVAPGAATEALSSVVMKLLGRTLVVTADVLQDHVQRGTQGMLENVAGRLTETGMAAAFAQVSGLPADVAAARASAFLRLVGRTLKPYTPAERREIRGLFFKAMDPLPPAAGRGFVDELARDSFVPNAEAASRLVQRTFDLHSERFVAFALGALELAGESVQELLEAALVAAADAMPQWMAVGAAALAEAERALAELGLQVLAASDAAATALDEALGDLADAFGAIGAPSRRSALKTRMADAFVDAVDGTLEDHPLYRALPSEFRSAAKASARDLVRGLAHGLAAPIFDAVATAASDVGGILDDVRELDPSTGLAAGVSDLVLDQVERSVRDAFGGDDPGFNVGFSFTYEAPELHIGFDGVRVVMKTHRLGFDLGRIALPISRLIRLLRDVILATSGFESALARTAGGLRTWLEKELEAAAKRDEAARVSAEVDGLRSLRAAVSGAPRDIALASPAHGGVYRDVIPVRVALDGATSEFVRAVGGPDRVWVSLNAERLPASRFEVESVRPPAAAAAVGAGTREIPKSRTLSPITAIRASISGASIGLQAAFDRPDRVRGAGKTRPGGGAGGFLPGNSLRPGSNFGGKPGAKLRGVDFDRSVSGASEGRVVLRGELDLSECVEGFNVLSVTIIGSEGERLTRSLTFVVEAPAAPPAPPSGGGPIQPPVVLPPRWKPIDPAKLRPKPKPVPVGPAGLRAKSDAAKAAVIAATVDPTTRLSAVSPMLQAKLKTAKIGGMVPMPTTPPVPARRSRPARPTRRPH